MTESSSPVLFLDPESENFQRDFDFARLVFQGAVPRTAAKRVGITPEHGRQLFCRWRGMAAKWAGQQVSDTLVLRLICERERAEADLQKYLVTGVTKSGAGKSKHDK